MSGWKYAFSLSKYEVLEATPPGTAKLMYESESSGGSRRSSASLIRFPQPSEDPADPLNWPTWRKFGLLLTVGLYSFAGNFTSASIAPALQLWFKEFPTDHRPFSDLTYFIAYVFAKAIYTVFLAGGPLLGGIAGGYIGFQLGWTYIFWVGAAISAACIIGVFFFIPETLYDRVISPTDPGMMPVIDEKGMDSHVEDARSQVTQHKPYTFARSLGFTHYRGGVLRNFIAPWRTLALPGTWVVMFHYAGLVGGIVTISTIGPQIMAQPPYLWGANVGLINVGGILGTLFGALYTYLLSDSRLKKTVKTQGGLAEPESRLPTMFPALVIATGGFFTFGFVAQYPSKNGWVGLCFGYAMVAFGLMQVPSIGFNYLIDSYGRLSGDCFVIVTIMRAIIAFAWTFFVSHWVEDRGAAEPFGVFGMLMGIFALLTVPLWLYGKRTRIATAGVVERA
ncbi:hypothetical protein N0V92_004397 [Colletotrichum tropicale]|nr:hypothetical protein N0V92_004397 [Colletotrichum tropicale]